MMVACLVISKTSNNGGFPKIESQDNHFQSQPARQVKLAGRVHGRLDIDSLLRTTTSIAISSMASQITTKPHNQLYLFCLP